MDDQIDALRKQIAAAESQLQKLRLQLRNAEHQAESAHYLQQAYAGGFPPEWLEETLAALGQDTTTPGPSASQLDYAAETVPPPIFQPGRWPLSADEYKRYGRQLIVPEIGLHGQMRLKAAKVLIVGMGGLGSPAAAYLAGAGVGTLGLMDGDTVEVSNLHRQIAHATPRVGTSKVDSACVYLSSLNPSISYVRHQHHLTPETALAVFERYDLVLDCTDHPTSRYLISDTCVLTGKPLVSASALKTEGQLMVLNNPPTPPGANDGGPCYRCVFPKPPPAENVVSCGEGGILGPIVGVMGVLQALEAIKVMTTKPKAERPIEFWEPEMEDESTRPTLLMFSAYSSPQFRSVRLRSRRKDCAACSPHASISRHSLSSGSLDYIAFCGVTAPVNVLSDDTRISATEFARLPRDGSNVLIDVRDETQYSMCALRGSINIPWTGDSGSWIAPVLEKTSLLGDQRHFYVVCRFGNDSQLATKAIEAWIPDMEGRVKDIKGGFASWRKEVDPSWPDY